VPNATERSGAEAAQNPTSAIKARGPQDSEHSIVVTRQDSLPAWKKDKPEKDLKLRNIYGLQKPTKLLLYFLYPLLVLFPHKEKW